MKRLGALIAVFILFSSLFATIGSAAEPAGYAATIAAAREIVWKTLTTGGGSSATVAVMDGGKIVYSEQFGAAERATNRPADRETRFNIGSTS
ncbi:MAG TPA: serine hydrolase, partial [Synergistales bacterium]|nr:serine hydrolase [Synergistales bacterium]